MWTDPASDRIRRLASTLLGKPVGLIDQQRTGGNNRLYRIEAENNAYAMKFYPRQTADRRDRLGQEYTTLDFLWSAGVSCVPQPIAICRPEDCAVYTWIDGEKIATATTDHVQAMWDFVARLRELRDTARSCDIGPASASCLSPSAVFNQLDDRLERLKRASHDDDDLDDFLLDRFEPARARIVREATQGLDRHGISLDRPLETTYRVLSPSDFGLHNMIRRPDGTLAFVDFEYFGWDDPVKMVADILLHPGMELPSDLKAKTADNAMAMFGKADGAFAARMKNLFPVFGLIWCLIILNEFLPERWARRVVAGKQADLRVAKEAQLRKAEGLLDWILDGYEVGHFCF